MSKLTAKQEAFAILLAAGQVTQSEAYRQAYKPGTAREASIHELACRMAGNVKVMSRVDVLQRETRAEIQLTRESYCRELLSLSAEARSKGAYSAAVSAMSAVGRCLGMNAPTDVRVEHSLSLSTLTMEQLVAIASARPEGEFLEHRPKAIPGGPENTAPLE